MPCCRCSIPTATPPAASGRDWASCDSGWGRRVRPTAWPRSPWSWRGEARPGRATVDGARGGTGSLARGDLALPRAGVGARGCRSSERTTRDLCPMAQSHPPAAVPPTPRVRGSPDQPPSRRRLPRRAVRALGVPCGARVLAARGGRRSAGPRPLSASGWGGRPHARRPAWPRGADEARRAGCGAARQRGGDRCGRAGLVGVVDRVVGSVLPAQTVRQGGDRVQRAVRRGGGKGGVASRNDRGRAGTERCDVRQARGRRGRVNAARVVRWLWGGSRGARVARVPLMPLAGAYWAVMKLRAARGRADAARLPLPTIAVGNLSVGGTGKTPLAAWIADYCVARGRTPGILLRGYGGDEPLVHRRLVPQAVVIANPDRVAGAVAARAQGARVLVLDDAYQLLGVERDLNIAVVSAESAAASPWPLPAGPWREGRDALVRADLIVVTRKSASAEAADALARQLRGRGRKEGPSVCTARRGISHLEGMQSGWRRELDALAGRRVVAAAGIADPESFAAQLGTAGASVQLVAYQDHHTYLPGDLERLVQATAAGGDYVVVTEKDAGKLRPQWPGGAPEPLVAGLTRHREQNRPAARAAGEPPAAP